MATPDDLTELTVSILRARCADPLAAFTRCYEEDAKRDQQQVEKRCLPQIEAADKCLQEEAAKLDKACAAERFEVNSCISSHRGVSSGECEKEMRGLLSCYARFAGIPAPEGGSK